MLSSPSLFISCRYFRISSISKSLFVSCRYFRISSVSKSLILGNRFSSTPFSKQSSLQISSSYCIKTGFSCSSLSSSTFSIQRPPIIILRSHSSMASQSTNEPGSIHEFTVKDARGKDVNLSTYKGKVMLIVNVASQCGLTNSNYTELSQLYEKYKDKDFEILAFPCNQFGEQEPGNNEEILEFVCTRFKAEYPIFDKVDVNGEKAAPVYKFLKSSKGGIFGDSIKWNFSKFLVDKDGHVVDRYAPTTSPLTIEKDIKKLLGLS